ncbi:MAG: RNA methyltransferase [Bacteroidales bacterium]|nr:RNA methyltransferase [Bacteroidales bacterium]
MKKLSMEDLNRMDVNAFKQSNKFPVVVVLDNVRSMNNIGSIFRSCDAFRTELLCLCGITAQPPHKDIEKTAIGATQSVAWRYFDSTQTAVDYLIDRDYAVFAIEQAEQSIPLNEFEKNPHRKLALVFGNEVLGVEQEIIDKCCGCIEIPQFGTKHSLNIAVSAGIVLWHVVMQCRQTKEER